MKFIQVTLARVPIMLIVAAMACGCNGCNKAKLKALTNKAKAAATEGTENLKKQMANKVDSATAGVQEQLQLAGDIKLTLDAPIETKACYARFISQGKRKTVFELRSYSSPDQESAPSVFFHAQIAAASIDELSGQVVSGRLFVQPTVDGPTWYSAAGSPVELKITITEDKKLTAEIVSASLQNTTSDVAINATGTFSAVQQ